MGPKTRKTRNLSLSYWVRGQSFDVWHTVEVSPDKTIRMLRELIVQNSHALSGCDAAALRVYKVPADQPVLEDDSLEHNLGRLSISVLGTPLRARQAANIFTPVHEDQLHFIIDAADLKVSYWLRGASHGNSTVVRVSNTGIVDDLKSIIHDKEKDLAAISMSRLRLYKISWKNDELIKSLDATGVGQLIGGASWVRTLFDDVPFNAMPCVVVEWLNESASQNLQLNCLVLGNDSSQYFIIKITGTANVRDLKKLIKQRKANDFHDIDANNLDLYEVSLPTDGELDEKLRHLRLNAPLDPGTELWTFFAQMVKENIHILVKQHDNRLRVEQDNIITVLTECETFVIFSDKREPLINVVQSAFKRTIAMSQSLTPSKAAKSSEYVKIQCGDRRLIDCRCAAAEPANTVAPAIQLFSPAFAYFSSRAFDPEYDVPDDFIRNVQILMTRFTLTYTSEQDRRNHLLTYLEKAIGRPLDVIVGPDKTAPDFVAKSSCEELSVYLIVGKEKNELGDRGSDPSVQAAFSFLHIFRQEKNAGLLMRCCCPTFIVALAGPWLTIMGGIITDKCIVQRLTDFLWVPVHSINDYDQSRRMARVFYALKESTQRLDLWYKTIKAVTPFDISTRHIHSRFCPTPNTYCYKNTLVKFAYRAPLEQSDLCVTYLASTIEDKRKDIVVKFFTSYTYGEDVHVKMASLGFAPELFYCGPIKVTDDMPSYGKLRMVVMGYVEGLTLEVALQQRKVPQKFTDDLTRAFEELHGAGYVFGDLREPNVIVTSGLEGTSTAQLIDFDWAGKEGEAKYPVSISSSINWPPEVQGLVPIRKEHDVFMLEALKFRCSRYQPADPKGKRRAIDAPSGQSPSKKTVASMRMEVDAGDQ